MLTIHIKSKEFYDEARERFVKPVEATLQLEHSLVSLSKWEQKFEVPFLGPRDKSDEEVLGYIEAMNVSDDFPPGVLLGLSQQNVDEINAYINAKMTATWFAAEPGVNRNPEVITSELIYYWMVAYNIPFECQHWHLNRLFTLIKICNLKNQKQKKMSRMDAARQQRELNEKRRQQLGTSG